MFIVPAVTEGIILALLSIEPLHFALFFTSMDRVIPQNSVILDIYKTCPEIKSFLYIEILIDWLIAVFRRIGSISAI